jgi:Mce-associated membrane protein
VIDADRVEEATADPDRPTDAEQARVLAEEAEAEAAEADAMAAAARARARAARLRREALEGATQTAPGTAGVEADVPTESVETDGVETAGVEPVNVETEVSTAADSDITEAQEAGAPRQRRRMRLKPTKFGVAVAAIIVAILGAVAGLAASGYMIIEHRNAEKVRQQTAEYSAAARQSVVTLMSLDFNNAEADVQRIIDNSTGQFKSDFESQAADFVKVAQDSKVVTEVTVNSTAVESMSDDKAEVLVAAASRVTNTAGANQEPRTWRLSVSLEREDGQIKMAKVEFVP